MRQIKLFIPIIASLFFASSSFAQTDNIRIMQYNLLNYGNGANGTARKDTLLRKIIHYVNPDIFGGNEIYKTAGIQQHIIDSVLGPGWEKGTMINHNNQDQTDMLYWRSAKFGLKSEQSVCYNLRDIIAFKLYYKDTITIPHDTTYLTIIVAHLKASSTSQDSLDRAAETQQVAHYLDSVGPGNYIFQGDLNVYTSDEQAYQNLVNDPNTATRLYDPINRPGHWNSNSSFSDIHTQSTRIVNNLGDGGANGGLDDRFDIQLASGPIINNTAGVMYIPGSYHVAGNDGQHYNKGLIDAPVNTAAPDSVIQSLYYMSDHLPIYANYQVTAQYPSAVTNLTNTNYEVRVVNPIDNHLSISFDRQLVGRTVNIRLSTIQGVTVFNSTTLLSSSGMQHYPIDINSGIYFLTIRDNNSFTYSTKILKY